MGEPDRKPHAAVPTDPLVTRETGPTGEGSLIATDLSAAAGDTDDPPSVYLPPSPNLNCFAAQLLYLGTCLFEGTNISEGRGTANPFQQLGAPWRPWGFQREHAWPSCCLTV